MADKSPSPPSVLGKPGRLLWKSVTSTFELDVRELEILRHAGICADRIAELDATVDREGLIATGSHGDRPHPALVEARLQRAQLSQLLGRLDLPDSDESAPKSFASQRASRAAAVRWERLRAARGDGATQAG